MTKNKETKQLAPWAYMLPADWSICRMDSVADVIFSNVDKHTINEELPARLCNYVDVYKNDRINRTIDFMEASADRREIRKLLTILQFQHSLKRICLGSYVVTILR
jgi:hypothetical protein